MGRRPAYAPLHVYMNNRCVGMLTRQPSGAIEYTYDTDWLDWEHAMPLSLSLPLRENPYRGEPVSAVFENLLPDSATAPRRRKGRRARYGRLQHADQDRP